MHSKFAIRILKPRLALSGFPLFLAKVGFVVGLWLGLWAALFASTALENPRLPVAERIHSDWPSATGAEVRLDPLDRASHQFQKNNPRWSLVSHWHLSSGER
jgi:hypothetical protein